MFGYDDSLDAFGVHGVGGIIGALLTGVFADPAINALGEGASIGKQLYGIIFTILWTAIATAVILYVVKALVGLRPTKSEEVEGLDITSAWGSRAVTTKAAAACAAAPKFVTRGMFSASPSKDRLPSVAEPALDRAGSFCPLGALALAPRAFDECMVNAALTSRK